MIYAATTDRINGTIAVINGSNNKVGSPINALAINEKTNMTYANPIQPSDIIYIIDGSSDQVIDKIKVTGAIQSVSVDSQTNRYL